MKKSLAIIGGGPSALMAAAFLDPDKFEVTIYEKNKSTGRKFLVAGDGGFNLTHSEPIEIMASRYTPEYFLKNALFDFTNEALQNWLSSLGIATFIGSSKRVYPEKGIKPIAVLNSIMDLLAKNNVRIAYCHSWTGWSEKNEPIFNNTIKITPDFTIFALGGGSWKVTGSEGDWLNHFEQKGVKTLSFLPSNCAYKINWPQDFITKNEGAPLKNISLSCLDKTQKGELVITQFGLEGNAIYALSPQIQFELLSKGAAALFIDLKPMLTMSEINHALLSSMLNTTDTLKKVLNFSSAQLSLLKATLSKEEFTNVDLLSKKIKALPLIVSEAAPLDEAISTTGGIALEEVNENFEFHKLKNAFCIGEMLDWNAPTGGYLLQACFSMGASVARKLNLEN